LREQGQREQECGKNDDETFHNIEFSTRVALN
jgi:hypothetical protein